MLGTSGHRSGSKINCLLGWIVPCGHLKEQCLFQKPFEMVSFENEAHPYYVKEGVCVLNPA